MWPALCVVICEAFTLILRPSHDMRKYIVVDVLFTDTRALMA